MRLCDIKRPRKANSSTKRVGRGVGSGMDKTSGRGHKGAKARSGSGMYLGFEGGQMPLIRRIPKRGFNNAAFADRFSIINVSRLSELFSANDVVEPEVLIKKGLAKKRSKIKILGNGEINIPLTVKAHKVSKSAAQKIEAAGGKVEIILTNN